MILVGPAFLPGYKAPFAAAPIFLRTEMGVEDLRRGKRGRLDESGRARIEVDLGQLPPHGEWVLQAFLLRTVATPYPFEATGAFELRRSP